MKPAKKKPSKKSVASAAPPTPALPLVHVNMSGGRPVVQAVQNSRTDHAVQIAADVEMLRVQLAALCETRTRDPHYAAVRAHLMTATNAMSSATYAALMLDKPRLR